MSYAYGICRTVTGHHWVYQPDELITHWRHPGYAYVFTCAQCGTTKHVWFNRRGEVLACRYLYPDGYATDEERTALRKQALRSLNTKAMEDHE